MSTNTVTISFQKQEVNCRQAVYDMWLENTIPSTDFRNGRNCINISKRRFQPHADLNTRDFVVEDNINKRGQIIMSSSKLIATLTVRAIKEKLKNNNIDVSIGTIISLKPFWLPMPLDEKWPYVCAKFV